MSPQQSLVGHYHCPWCSPTTTHPAAILRFSDSRAAIQQPAAALCCHFFTANRGHTLHLLITKSQEDVLKDIHIDIGISDHTSNTSLLLRTATPETTATAEASSHQGL